MIRTSLLIVYYLLTAASGADGQNLYKPQRSEEKHTGGAGNYYYLRNDSLGKQLYFFNEANAADMAALLNNKVISFPEFFTLHGFEPMSGTRTIEEVSEELFSRDAILVTSIEADTTVFKNIASLSALKLIIRTECRMQYNAGICISLKGIKKPVSAITEQDVSGKPELCINDY